MFLMALTQGSFGDSPAVLSWGEAWGDTGETLGLGRAAETLGLGRHSTLGRH